MHKSLRSLVPATLLIGALCACPPPGRAQTAAPTASPDVQRAHTYRLVYTVTESDSGKRLGVQHFAMTVVSGRRAKMKQGSKVPVVTGGYTHEGTAQPAQYQITYLDVGLNIDSTLTEDADGLQLAVIIEQSGLLDSLDAITKDPVIRQAKLDNSTLLKLGAPIVLGSLDVPGSTRHLDFEVVAERMP